MGRFVCPSLCGKNKVMILRYCLNVSTKVSIKRSQFEGFQVIIITKGKQSQRYINVKHISRLLL